MTGARGSCQPVYVVVDEGSGLESYASAVNAWLPEFHGQLRSDHDRGAFLSIIYFSATVDVALPLTSVADVTDLPGAVASHSPERLQASPFSVLRDLIQHDLIRDQERAPEWERPILIFLAVGGEREEDTYFRAAADLQGLPIHLMPRIVGVALSDQAIAPLQRLSSSTFTFGAFHHHMSQFGLGGLTEVTADPPATDDQSRGEELPTELARFKHLKPWSHRTVGERPAQELSRPCFISHATSNRDLAGEFAQTLENNGIRTWLASRDVRSGFDYAAAIVNAIEQSHVFVALLSQDSTTSQHCLRELDLALEIGKTIIPVWLEKHTLPHGFRYRLATIQIASTAEDVVDALSDLYREA